MTDYQPSESIVSLGFASGDNAFLGLIICHVTLQQGNIYILLYEQATASRHKTEDCEETIQPIYIKCTQIIDYNLFFNTNTKLLQFKS